MGHRTRLSTLNEPPAPLHHKASMPPPPSLPRAVQRPARAHPPARPSVRTVYIPITAGELPDVRSIKASSLLAPLAGLTDGDGQFAIATLACFTSAAVAAASEAGLRALHAALREAFAARPGKPGYAHALQAVAARVPGVELAPGDVVAAAAASGSFQAGALQLEAQLIHQQHHGQQQQQQAPTWSAVADLYARLGEPDLVCVVRERLLRCPGSGLMLAAEAAGRPYRAQLLAEGLVEAKGLLVGACVGACGPAGC